MRVTEEDIVYGPEKTQNAPHCWLLQALLYNGSTVYDKFGLLAVFASLTSPPVLKI